MSGKATAAVPASVAWSGKRIRLVLLGRKHLNGERFTETYNIDIVEVTDPASMDDLIRDSLDAARKKTDIPADLLEGVEFRLLPIDTTQRKEPDEDQG